jgi:4-alpha-glucanotransferase
VDERRRSGVLLPLFSVPSTRSWGIGEIGDLPDLAGWLRSAGLDLLQMLPVNEMASGQSSPYSALSAMAIDPIFVSLHDVYEFQQLGGEAAVSPDTRARLDAVRRSPHVAYADVRALKADALRASYARFRKGGRRSKRCQAFDQFVAAESWWLEDYALFRALHDRHDRRAWWTWDPALQARDAAALARARTDAESDVRYYQYVQWLADQQWREARRQVEPIGLFGDLPFMVGADSADVWAHQDFFARDLSVGTPPDAFSATGQDWGLPAYRWDATVASDFQWLRARARRACALFDGFRVDHVIGFYRTFVRPEHQPGVPAGAPFFTPADESEQLALGERILRLFQETGARVIAEDLGTVPDFLRESLARLPVPGYRVLRWERDWHAPGQPFRNPADYPAESLATTGTHDTDPLAVWWETAPIEERRDVARIPGFPADRLPPDHPFDDAVRDALLWLLYASGSRLLVLPMQDLFGWRDRVNTPATVGEENWTWRLPWPVDRLLQEPEPRDRARTLRTWARETGRGLPFGTD